MNDRIIPPPNQRPNLGVAELNSGLWREIHEHFTKRLQMLRETNDARTKGKRETAFIRGQIAMAKEILSLGDDTHPTMG